MKIGPAEVIGVLQPWPVVDGEALARDSDEAFETQVTKRAVYMTRRQPDRVA
jgi:hypothetical protein